MSSAGAIDRLTARLEADSSVSSALLFGSAVHDELRAHSDLDVGVLWSGPAPGTSALLAILADLESVTGRPVQLVDLDSAALDIARVVFDEGRLLFTHDAPRLHARHEAVLIDYWDGAWMRRDAERNTRERLERLGEELRGPA